MRHTERCYGVLVLEIEGDEEFIDFVSKDIHNAKKYMKETWDKDAAVIIEGQFIYESTHPFK